MGKEAEFLQFGASDQPDEQLVAVGLAVEHPKWSPLDVFTPPPHHHSGHQQLHRRTCPAQRRSASRAASMPSLFYNNLHLRGFYCLQESGDGIKRSFVARYLEVKALNAYEYLHGRQTFAAPKWLKRSD